MAIVNFQEILVDTNSAHKADGLRPYLQKDEKSLQLLNVYQEKSRIKWPNTVLGTLGTVMLLIGVTLSKDTNSRGAILAVGGGIFGLNFIVGRSLEQSNEINLMRAIEEYNKRNTPRIYFDNPSFLQQSSPKSGASLNFSTDF